MGITFFKFIALFLAILFPLVAIGEVTSSSPDGCHCGMAQCYNCCNHNGPKLGTLSSSCLCASLACVPGDFLDFQIWPSSSLFLAGSKPVRVLFALPIFHPPEIS